MRGILGVIVLVWLVIGVIAAYQRDYFKTTADQLRDSGDHRAHGGCRSPELRGSQPEGHQVQRARAQSVTQLAVNNSKKGVAMIVLERSCSSLG